MAVKAALQTHDIPGKIILLGTPGIGFSSTRVVPLLNIAIAEEGGGGKILLLERGAYREMDLCIMYDVTSLMARSYSPAI